MDGFAVRAAETPAELPIAFRVAAGAAPPGPLPEGTAAGIATGGTVPAGADAVVPIEVVEDRGDRLFVPECRRAPGSTSARAAATWVPVPSSSSPARCSARCRSAPLPPPASQRSLARLGHGSRSSPPVTSSETRARSSSPVRSTSRIGAWSPLRWRARAPRSTCFPSPRTMTGSHRAAIERGLHGGCSRHVGRRFDGAARPRSARCRRARGGGGLLGRRGQARESRLRSACEGRLSCSGCPGTPCRRSSERCCSSAPRSSRVRVTRGRGRATSAGVYPPRFAGIRTATSSCALGALESSDGRSARGRHRPGVAHDRARRGSRRPRPRSPWRGRDRGRWRRSVPRPRLTAPRASPRNRAARWRLGPVRVRRIPAERDGGDLCGRREPDECHEHRRQRDVAHGGKTDRVEGRADDRDPELVREKQERDQRPDEARLRREARAARTGARSVARARRRATAARRRGHRDSRVQGRPPRPRPPPEPWPAREPLLCRRRPTAERGACVRRAIRCTNAQPSSSRMPPTAGFRARP